MTELHPSPLPGRAPYDKKFIEKFKVLESLPGYERLIPMAQSWIDNHSDCSLYGITCDCYMEAVLDMTDEDLLAWGNRFISKTFNKEGDNA